MKLEFDNVRNILLKLEDETDLTNFYEFDSETTDQDIIYTIIKLTEAGYINSKIEYDMSGNTYGWVKSITWSGHAFLDNIRSPKAVAHTKNVLKEIGSASIQIMSQVAAAFIQSKLGL